MVAGLQTQFHGEEIGLKSHVDLPRMLTPEAYRLETERIFRRAWLPLCKIEDVPEKGSYVVRDMPTFNTSVLVIHGRDDKIRVFHNACKHRGNKVVREGKGCRNFLACNFHGWVYTAEGELQRVTDESQFPPIDKAATGLTEIHSEVWENFVFVNFDKVPRFSLADWLGPIYDQYKNYFGEHENVTHQEVMLDANWHLGVNSFTEGYHTLYLHQSTARDYQGGKGNPDRHRPSMELLGRHHRYSAPGNPNHRQVPAEALASRYGRMILPSFDYDLTGLPTGVNSTRFATWGFDVLELFPNFVMLTGNCWHNELWFWPIDAGRTLCINRGFTYKAKTLGNRISRSYFRSRIRDVFREDLNTLEAQQTMLTSGAMREIILSRQEMALQHHYKIAEEMMAEG